MLRTLALITTYWGRKTWSNIDSFELLVSSMACQKEHSEAHVAEAPRSLLPHIWREEKKPQENKTRQGPLCPNIMLLGGCHRCNTHQKGSLYFILLFSVHKNPQLRPFCLLNALNSFQTLGGVVVRWTMECIHCRSTQYRMKNASKTECLKKDHTS